MANQTEQNNNEQGNKKQLGFFQKNRIPLTILVVGIAIIIPLYWFLVVKQNKLTTAADILNAADAQQEMYQAPADLSVSVQIECQSSVEKINKTDDCAKQEEEFFNKADSCLNYSYSLEKPKNIQVDGSYGDILFNILHCYQRVDGSDAKQQNLLTKAINFPQWDVNLGPITCDSKQSIEAYLDALTQGQSFNCMKPQAFATIKAQIQEKNLSVLNSLINKEHPPQLGTKDSDVSCVRKLKDIQNQLSNIMNQKVELNVGEPQQDQSQSQFIEVSKAGSSMALIKFSTDENDCLYFDSLLTSEQLEEQ